MTTAKPRVMVSLTGTKVHFPAMISQEDTSRTRCAPMGRMGARQMRLRFAQAGGNYVVNCQPCLKAGPPTT